jgi:hypothetical protein
MRVHALLCSLHLPLLLPLLLPRVAFHPRAQRCSPSPSRPTRSTLSPAPMIPVQRVHSITTSASPVQPDSLSLPVSSPAYRGDSFLDLSKAGVCSQCSILVHFTFQV